MKSENKKRVKVFSNVKNNKKAENKSACLKKEQINLDQEIIIGLTVTPEPKEISKVNKKKNHKVIKGETENAIKKENKKIKPNKVKNKSKKKEPKELTHKQKIARQKRKIIFKLLRWTTLFIVLIGGIIYFMLSPVFNIKTVNINGNNQISDETILSLSGINLNENMFKLSKNEIIKKIKQNAYIDEVKISRKLPDTIEIDVTERYATFMIEVENMYGYINNQGYILEITSSKLELPIIQGLTTSSDKLTEGERLCKEDLEKLDTVLKIMESAENNDLTELITRIDITNDSDYKIIFERENKTAYIGDASILETRMLYVKTILEKEEGNAGEIFVNMDLNTEYPFFREKV